MNSATSTAIRWGLPTALWLSVIVAWLVLEAYGIIRPDGITFTELVRRFVPLPVQVMIWAWLGWHFIVQTVAKKVLGYYL